METFLNFNLSLKLHRIGIKTVSGFYYQKSGRDKVVYASKDIFTGMSDFDNVYVPAYLSSDLDHALPAEIELKDSVYNLTVRKTKLKYDVRYEDPKGSIIYREYSASPAEARARVILFLEKKNLLKNEN